jgi:hypothetical protein
MKEANDSQTTAGVEGKQRRVGVAYHAVVGLPVAEMQRKYYLGYAEAKRVAEEAVTRQMALLEASRCIRHWHDTAYNPETGECEGMIVSANAVRSLWDARSALDEQVWPNAPIQPHEGRAGCR